MKVWNHDTNGCSYPAMSSSIEPGVNSYHENNVWKTSHKNAACKHKDGEDERIILKRIKILSD
jgi:hypothetical protein